MRHIPLGDEIRKNLSENRPLNVLLIAEAANPEWTSVPLVGWSHSRAIQALVGGHIVTQIRNKGAFERAGVSSSEFTAVDSEALLRPAWKLSSIIRGGSNKGWTTVAAIQAITYPYFEHLLWKQFGKRLKAGEFDLVHRITPLSPTSPSSIAKRLHGIGVPFVVGPLNGGIPWPKEFDRERRQEKEWLSYVRGAYKFLPGYRATRKYASAIICGSKATLEQMPSWCRDKCYYIPENAIDPTRFPEPAIKPSPVPLRIAFVGRLVAYKGADMLLEATAPLIRDGRIVLDIIGDGPEMPRLLSIANQLGIESGVTFGGWVPHERLHERLSSAHVFGFPSIREFGGGVVLEAMALGLVPVVVDYGGPGELVSQDTGIVIPLGNRQQIISRLGLALESLLQNPTRMEAMRLAGRPHVLSRFTWEAKAKSVLEIYDSVLNKNLRHHLDLA